jgi:carboxylesterase
MPLLMPGAEPFYLPGGPVGALLLHGFTGAPREMRPLAEALTAAGLSALAPRLAHHGTRLPDMFRTHWHDWAAAALDGYHLLRGQCPTVFVMGLSLGGNLALWLAAQALPGVAGVVGLSTPGRPFLEAMGGRARFARPLCYLVPFVDKGPADPEGDPGHVHYPRYPVRAIPQLRALLAEVDTLLPAVTVPALLAHSRADPGVAIENVHHIAGRLGSAQKTVLELERSGHVVTEGPERALLFARVLAFVRAQASASP